VTSEIRLSGGRHHFIEDGYLPSILPVAAAIAARTKRIRIASEVLLMPFHNPVRLQRISP
jgi:alkanesulfonate monooxygenase SsuD/methylene tetrahydromethanopterin reductase-like flavin-dependent oxidoreductase (luciferase family)